MTEKTIAYARALRRLAQAHRAEGGSIVLTLPPVSADHIAKMIERGAMRSRYVSETMDEADKLRDRAEALMLDVEDRDNRSQAARDRAREINAAADRVLDRVTVLRRWYLAGAVVAIFLAVVLGLLIGVGLAWQG